MSQDSQEIKTIEQWKWSEMQGLELVSPPHPSSEPFKTNSASSTPTPTLTINSTQQEQNNQTHQPTSPERREMDDTAPKKDGGGDGGSSSNTCGDGEKPGDVAIVGFGELFRFADGLDYVLMAIGSIGALVHGSSLPLFLRFFADLVNSFGSNANDVDKMMQEVLKVKKRKQKQIHKNPIFEFPF